MTATLKALVSVALLSVTVRSDDDMPWWKTAVIYQVYPRSFKDSDGDGIGDLKGIIQKANYFYELGVDGIWLSPVYKSPMVDLGYDISDYKDIDPIFGSMADFDNLIIKMNSLGIRVLMDFVPNHSSDQHPWFQSALNKSDPHHEDYKDFYIWRNASGWNGSTPLPPNNWFSVFEGPAWDWNEDLQQFYLHQFKKQQPDLNYRNPNVVGNMTDVLTFWLNKGVSGFRVDAADHLYENATFADQPPVPGTNGNDFWTQMHTYVENQPETYELISNWTDFVRKRDLLEGVESVFLLEIYNSIPTTMSYYMGYNRMTMPFNLLLLFLTSEFRSQVFKYCILLWMDSMPQGGVSSWVTGNHDNLRVADRDGSDMVDVLNLLSGVLPGMKVTYYGEEFGMQDTHVRADEQVDHSLYHRDNERTPMQWDDTPNAGFSTNSSTWLPVNPNYWWLNVAAQQSAQSSHLKVFQAMAKARKDPVLQRGDLQLLTPDDDTLVVVRSYNNSSFVLLINFGSKIRTYTSQNVFNPNALDMDMLVVVSSINTGINQGNIIRKGSIQMNLRPKSAVLLRSLTSSPTSSAVLTLPHNSSLFIVILLLVIPHLTYA